MGHITVSVYKDLDFLSPLSKMDTINYRCMVESIRKYGNLFAFGRFSTNS